MIKLTRHVINAQMLKRFTQVITVLSLINLAATSHVAHANGDDNFSKNKFNKCTVSLYGSLSVYDLVNRAIQNEERAFTELVDRYYSKIYFSVYKMCSDYATAEDFTMEGFEKAFARISSYKFDGSFEGWLRRIVTNNAIDKMRVRKLKVISTDAKFKNNEDSKIDLVQLKDLEMLPDQMLISMDRAKKLHDALDKLDKTTRDIITMREFEELAFDEIAEKLEIGLAMVKSRLYRGKQKLKELLDNKLDN